MTTKSISGNPLLPLDKGVLQAELAGRVGCAHHFLDTLWCLQNQKHISTIHNIDIKAIEACSKMIGLEL